MSEAGPNINAGMSAATADGKAGMRVALTGGDGFIGRGLVQALQRRGASLCLLQRHAPQDSGCGRARVVALGDLVQLGGLAESAPAAWLVDALRGSDALVHLAGRAHRATGSGTEALKLYRATNTAPTVALARAAAAAGVRHMAFASTSHVHGHVTEPGRPFHSASPLNPSGAYATSKAEAEQALRQIAAETGLAVTIIRPAVVHGPGPTANIQALMQAVRQGAPLPLASVRNRRSFLGLDNLTDFISHVLAAPPDRGAVNAHTLADAATPSTPDFIRMLGVALRRPARLVPFPPGLLRLALLSAGRRGMAESLLDSLEIDIGPVVAATGWRPPLTLAEGLARMAAAQAGGEGRP